MTLTIVLSDCYVLRQLRQKRNKSKNDLRVANPVPHNLNIIDNKRNQRSFGSNQPTNESH